MAEKYLYGAAVQGIQGFIFQTNELREIVGASAIVAQICEDEFNEFRTGTEADNVLHAAGNIKYIFSKKDDCEKAVRKFPKKVLLKAPGITISQAVVKIGEGGYKEAVEELEARLRTQRNRQPHPTTLGLMGIRRSRKTGLPAINGTDDDAATTKKTEVTDEAHLSLLYDQFGKGWRFDSYSCKNIERLTGDNDYVAIVHIDGNGLGQIVAAIGGDPVKFKDFSQKLDEATKAAAQKAFLNTKGDADRPWNILRPIVLSGDDHTVVCRGNIAVEYVMNFLQAFEDATKSLGEIVAEAYPGANHLTACAGIAFIKSSYPFYYGYDLAEALCERSKKDAKQDCYKEKNHGIAPSCLMFHKVQDSYVTSYDDIVRRELTPANGKTWEVGPYYLHAEDVDNERCSIDVLLGNVDKLDGKGSDAEKEANAIKSSLRKWLTAMHDDPAMAKQLVERMKTIRKDDSFIIEMTSPTFVQNRKKKDDKGKDVDDPTERFKAYDVLSLHSIKALNTKD